jgi:hypothetical protein
MLMVHYYSSIKFLTECTSEVTVRAISTVSENKASSNLTDRHCECRTDRGREVRERETERETVREVEVEGD